MFIAKLFRGSPMVILIIILLDQVTKTLICAYEPHKLSLIKNLFSLNFVTNTGSVWGIAHNQANILAWFGVIINVILFVLCKTNISKNPILMGMLMGGTLSNTIDRFVRGYVVDFLDFHIKTLHWPCFNVADIAIVISCSYFLFKKQ